MIQFELSETFARFNGFAFIENARLRDANTKDIS